MNKGFKVYFKEGMKNSKKTLKGKGNLLRYYLFLALVVLSIVCPLLLPVLCMASFRLARQAKYENNIEVCKLLKPSDNSKNYWTLVLVGLMKGLLFLAMLLVVAFLIGVCFLFGYGVQFVIGDYSGIIPLAFMVPGAVLLLIFLLVYPFATVPASFLVENTDGENASKVLFDSVHALKKTGKRTLFATYLVQYLITIGILAVGIIVPYLPVYFMQDYLGLGLTIILFTVSSVIMLKILPKYDLAFAIARLSLFEDLSTDVYKASQRVKGLSIKGIESIVVEDTLTALFECDDTAVKRVEEVIREAQEIKVVSVVEEQQVQEEVTPVVTEEQLEPKVETAPAEEVVETKVEKVIPEVKKPETPKVEAKKVVETKPVEEKPVVEEPVVEEVVQEEPAVEETMPVEEAEPILEEVTEESSLEEEVLEENSNEELVEELVEEPAAEEVENEEVAEETVEEPAAEEVENEEVVEETVEELLEELEEEATENQESDNKVVM